MADEDQTTDDVDEADDTSPEQSSRSVDISRRKGVRRQLQQLFDDVVDGFEDQSERADDIQDFWDIYNCHLSGRQFYDGNSKIFVPIVRNAIDARKTRFVNQMFPTNHRNVEVTSTDGKMPYATMSMLEHYVDKAQLRTKVMPALMKNGDVEGQYNLFVEWVERERQVTWKTTEVPEMEEGGAPNPAAELVETIRHETI